MMKAKRRKNPLQIRIQVLRVPARMSPRQYVRLLLRALDTGDLPRGVKVELWWRNPATRHGATREWQSGEFTEVISESSPGFSTVVRRTLHRKLMGAQ